MGSEGGIDGNDASPTQDAEPDEGSGDDGDSSAVEAGQPLTGSIALTQWVNSHGFVSAGLSALFAPYTGPESCVPTMTLGGCQSVVCSTPSSPPPTGVNAGTLTFTGGDLTSFLSLQPPAYEFSEAMGPLADATSTLRVEASGGVVPAFGPQSVVVPFVVQLASPSPTATTLSTASDMPVAWTQGVSGALMELSGSRLDGSAYFLCSWDATLGVGTVPQPILSVVAGNSGVLSYAQTAVSTFTAGSYTITLTAESVYEGNPISFE